MIRGSMGFTAALVVIGQDLNDTALANLAMSALLHHPLEFPAQRLQPRDPLPDLIEMPPGDAVGLMA